MEERLKLSRQIIGSLPYLVHTRPDLAFAVGFVTRFMERPTEEHMMAVKRILRYVAGMTHYGLTVTGDIDTRKSTSGTLFFLGSCLVSWQSLKQRVVAQSSREAEHVAPTTAATQGIWLA
jgi:hypothetical protein